MKALMAPAVYFDAQGVLLDHWSQVALLGTDDRAIVKMLTPFVTRGLNVGSKEEQMQDFVADLVAYFSAKLK